jgi:hypothetical protein
LGKEKRKSHILSALIDYNMYSFAIAAATKKSPRTWCLNNTD